MDDFMEKLLKEVSQDTNNIGNMNGGQPPRMQQPGAPYPADNMNNNYKIRQPGGNMTVTPLQSTQPLPNMPQFGMPQPNAQGMPQGIQVQPMQPGAGPQMQAMGGPQPQHQPQQPHPQMNPQQPMGGPQMQQVPPQMQPRGPMPGMNPAPGGYMHRQSMGGPVSFEDVSYFPDADGNAVNRPLPGAQELAMEARRTEAYEERFRNNDQGMRNAAGAEPPFDKDKFIEDIHSHVHTEVVKCYKNTEAAIEEAARNVKDSYANITSPKPIFRFMIVLLMLDLILDVLIILRTFFGLI